VAGGAAPGPYRRHPLLRRALPALRRLRALAHPAPRLTAFAPASPLRLPEHPIDSACRPAIDFHTHLGRWLTPDGGWMAPDVDALLRLMDAANLESLVNLDGRWGAELEANLERYDRAHPGRFFTFCHLDWTLLDAPDGAAALVASLEDSARRGARGVKVWKDLGLWVTAGGRRVLPDDPVLAPIWDAAGGLGLPVLVHTGDPYAFFQPVDARNERVEELRAYPSRSFAREGVATLERLLRAFEAMVANHPATTFVGAHVAGEVEHLAHVSELLDRYPNLMIDLSGRAPELGRQPRAVARLCARHADRVLFGTDQLPVDPAGYGVYFRLLESDDEYFSYAPGRAAPPHGRWQISGLALDAEILAQVYSANARRLLGLGPVT
jgi:predicted TIM-barrel fold metal-dependent hydrolase